MNIMQINFTHQIINTIFVFANILNDKKILQLFYYRRISTVFETKLTLNEQLTYTPWFFEIS